MAQFRAEKAGINAEVQQKLEQMYDVELELECRMWMEAITGEPFPECSPEELDEIERDFPGKEFYLALHNGIYLCKLIKALHPPALPGLRLVKPRNPFQERDLIDHFLKACLEYGVSKDCLFETEDLHSATNMNMRGSE
uniref:Calponin-homology (CH) domain-containing protein n=1 Tax=Amphimedon queenslandica TaxID=400682 RepID=A0A1X7UP59_AMPQE